MLSDHVADEYDAGRCSPILVSANDIEEGTLIYSPHEDMKRLELQRLSLKNTGKVQVRFRCLRVISHAIIQQSIDTNHHHLSCRLTVTVHY